jgi:hypothetical protein
MVATVSSDARCRRLRASNPRGLAFELSLEVYDASLYRWKYFH